jgi:7,8-dihydro-6-hydroxymethylpterin dimethyltransferase
VLREDGKLIPTTLFVPQAGTIDSNSIGEDAAAKSKDYIRRHWRYNDPTGQSGDLIERAKSHSLCISGMAFQDAWNIDLERLKRCCIHVVAPGNKMIPFCAYYLTSSSGQRLMEL